jgi:hypothetical protein
VLTFNEALHEYRWNGAVLPHVTGILAGLIDFSFVKAEDLERARAEGIAQHKLIELECKGGLDVNALDPYWKPHLAAFRTCVAETGFKIIASERKVRHPTYGYAGTLDMEAELFDAEAILDLKRSFYGGPVIGLQLAAYLEARNAERARERITKKLKKRYALRLLPGSKPPYRLKEYTDAEDFGVFLGLLKTQRWKEKYSRE